MIRIISRLSLLVLVLATSVYSARPDEGEGRREERGESRFEFALIGDTPYGPDDPVKLDRVIDEVNHDHGIAWVLHTGDIKNGSSPATDALIQGRFDQYQHFHPPFIYTPGDNEWTDTHRASAGGYNPLERLAFVRHVFFPHPGWSTGGHPMRVHTQAHEGFPTFVENQMWVRSRVVFASLHVVGSNDDLNPWTGIGNTTVTADQQAEFDARRAANLAWIARAFDVAAEIHAKGVFLFMQADPTFEVKKGDPLRAVFDPLLDAMFAKAVEFRKPVLLAHGDSHYFRLDKPALDAAGHRIENFSRVENFGETDVHWVKILVDPDSRNVFHVEPMVVPENQFVH